MPVPPPMGPPPLVGFKTIRNISRIWIMIYMLNPTRGGGSWGELAHKSSEICKFC